MGGIYGLVVWGAVGILLHVPLWTGVLSLLVLPFHYDDLKQMKWRARLVRLLWIYTLSVIVTGIIWLLIPKEDWKPGI